MKLRDQVAPRMWVNKALATAGLEVRRKPQVLVRSPHELTLTPDLLASDLAIWAAGTQLTVVQIGAYDGSANDPVDAILRRFDWRGVLVEPQLEPFERLAARHAGNENAFLLNAAVSDTDGERELFTVKEGPDWTGQVASFNRDHVEKQRRQLPAGSPFNIVATSVRTCTFDTLLSKFDVDHVDVVQIDAEGYDYELLKLFDVPRRLPAIVNYEHVHLSCRDREAAAQLLVSSGYKVAMTFSSGDTIAYRRPN